MADSALLARAQRLLAEERVGVLCTCAGEQPYGSPMNFVFLPAEGCVVFATSRATRKFHVLVQNPAAAFVVDNRLSVGREQGASESVIASGRVTEILSTEERAKACSALVERYAALAAFFADPRNAVLKLKLKKLVYTSGFDSGVELIA